jgi:hypothetical protein
MECGAKTFNLNSSLVSRLSFPVSLFPLCTAAMPHKWSIFDDEPFVLSPQVLASIAYLDDCSDYTELARLTFASGFLVDGFLVNAYVPFEQYRLLCKVCLP